VLAFSASLSPLFADTVQVSILDDAKGHRFEPQAVTIKAGDVIQWTNNTDKPGNMKSNHTVTPDDGFEGKFEDTELGPGDSYTSPPFQAPDKPITYHCNFHGDMTGSIIVAK
jgi:plastocyanin